MEKKTAYVIGAGAMCTRGFHPREGDWVVAADGGFDALKRLSIRPHVLVGDMDSVRHLPGDIPLVRFPARKDETDMALAVQWALERGCRQIKLYGALGGRLDHSLANLHLLADLARQGIQGRIVARDAVFFAVCNGSLALPPLKAGTRVSVFAWGGEARGVSLSGLAYTLYNAQLNAFMPLGISNEARGMPVKVSVASGVLLLMVGLQE